MEKYTLINNKQDFKAIVLSNKDRIRNIKMLVWGIEDLKIKNIEDLGNKEPHFSLDKIILEITPDVLGLMIKIKNIKIIGGIFKYNFLDTCISFEVFEKRYIVLTKKYFWVNLKNTNLIIQDEFYLENLLGE
jgi:hypothetical protein